VWYRNDETKKIIVIVIFVCIPIIAISDDYQSTDVLHSDKNMSNTLIYKNEESNILHKMQPVICTNAIGVVSIVTIVAAMLIIDKLANKGVIDTKWSFDTYKEKIFGITVYKGDQYYKNWSHPKNIEKEFPLIPHQESFFVGRYVYEKNICTSLDELDDLVDRQESLQILSWPHSLCTKLLKYKLSPTLIFISKNEELQLDDRLTQELANCRDSSVRDIQKCSSKLNIIFEKLGNEIVFQLKKILDEFKKIKIDPRLVTIVGGIVVGICESQKDENARETIEDDQQFLTEMNKKDIVKLFTDCSHYYALLDDFDNALNLNNDFSMQCCNQVQHFIDHENELSPKSVSLIFQDLQEKIEVKKELTRLCLQKIESYCKAHNKSGLVSNLMKTIKKISAMYQKSRNKNIEKRLDLNKLVTINIEDLLSFDPLATFSK